MNRRSLATAALLAISFLNYGCNTDKGQPQNQPAQSQPAPAVSRAPVQTTTTAPGSASTAQQPEAAPAKPATQPYSTQPAPSTQTPKSTQTAPMQGSQPGPTSPAKPKPSAMPKEATGPTTRRASSVTIDEKCGPRPDCFQYIAPTRMDTHFGGKDAYQTLTLPKTKDCIGIIKVGLPCFYEGDYVTFQKPSLTKKQINEGYKLRWNYNLKGNSPQIKDILADSKITYDELASLGEGKELRGKAYWRIEKDNKNCGEYGFDITAKACKREAPPAPTPEQPPKPTLQPEPAPQPEPVKPGPTQTQQQQQEVNIIINPPAAQPTPEPTPLPPVQTPPPEQPTPVPPPVPKEPQAKRLMVTPMVGYGINKLTTGVPVHNRFCGPCDLSQFKQQMEGPSYGAQVKYSRPTFQMQVDGTIANMKLKDGITGSSFAVPQSTFADRFKSQTIHAEAKKSFGSWMVKPTLSAEGAYTDLVASRAGMERKNILKEGLLGGGATIGSFDKSNFSLIAGYASKDVQALTVAPNISANRPNNVNVHTPFAKAAGEAYIGDHLNLLGNIRYFMPSNTSFDGSPARVTHMYDYQAGVKWWINPDGKVAVAPGVQYDGWRQRLDIPAFENLKNKLDRLSVGLSFKF